MVIKKSSLKHYFISLILLLIFSSPIMRFAVGFYPYLLVAIIIAIFIFINFFLKMGKFNHIMYIPFVLLFGMFLYIGVSQPYKTNSLFYSAISLVMILAAYWSIKQDKILVKNIAFVVLVIFYIFFIYSGMTYGFMPKDVNLYLERSSRNAVGAIALFLQILYSAAYFRVQQKLPLFTPLFTLIIAIIAFGRSGIALSAVLVAFTYWILFLKSSRNKKLLTFALLLGVLFIIIINLQQISDFLLLYTNFQGGIESPRHVMNQQYLEMMTLESFLVGTDLSTIPMVHAYGDNPHNSFVFAHSQFGVLYVLFLIFFISFIGYMVLFYKNTLVYGFLILIFLARVFVDLLALLDVSDFIFYFLVFCVYEGYKTSEVREVFKQKREAIKVDIKGIK